MSTEPRLQQAIAAARRRRAGIVALLALAAAVVIVAAAWRFGGPATMTWTVPVLAAVIVMLAWRGARALDTRWFARRLDRRADMEDSADLLLASGTELTGLKGLQRERLRERLATGPAPDLRPDWPPRALLSAWIPALLLAAGLWLWPSSRPTPEAPSPTAIAGEDAKATHTTLLSARLDIEPPAYTALPTRSGGELSEKIPAGSKLRWTLRFAPQPPSAEIVLHDGHRLALAREGEDWTGEHRLDRSALYRLVPGGPLPLRDDRLHRLDAIADQPPQLRVLAPERNLTLRADGQRDWALSFEASDDYGLGDARLMITLAQGSGEQVTVSERRLALAGEGDGDGRQRRYARRLDLAALGLAQGDDLIVRLEVDDKRAPSPQTSRSASYILRWPMPPATEATGMEGLVKKALPAYFRSQRQIILDAEALVGERPRLAADDFVARSDGIGVDQRILRMRYGQFLGEENVGRPAAPGDGEGHSDNDGHDHGAEPPADFGGPINVLEDYGHTHDDAEAATLLDPETRALLKNALDAMWSSEGELRQGQPERALPHAYRALGYIKQVQQATRIYLARVGLELPPIDESRRMGGDRAGLGDRRDGLVAASADEVPALALWQALAPGAEAGETLETFAAWLRANETTLTDPLDLVAALEAVRADPACADCRARLRERLWPLLPPAAAATAPRATPDHRGQAYLEALVPEESR